MKKLLTVEFNKDREAVEIHLNDLGIDFLIRTLKSLQLSQQNDHDHLMTQEWGGQELTSERQNLDSNVQLINHLKIVYWKD
ncbi:MAG: Imm32 family immunity protein [Bacteroidota bacterium]